MYDFIGDIHGHYDELVQLLQLMGYRKENNIYIPPTGRKAFFIGDYIDRGPKNRACLQLIRSMVEQGHAIALMGNHEFNAITFNERNKENDGYLRPHVEKNFKQNHKFLAEFEVYPQELQDYIDWFKTLPIYWEEAGFRACHACWNEADIQTLEEGLEKYCAPDRKLSYAFLKEVVDSSSQLHHSLDIIKGKKENLPKGMSYSDADGNRRRKARIRWWQDPRQLKDWNAYSVKGFKELEGLSIQASALEKACPYPQEAKPLFFGHYWLTGNAELLAPNVCCLDYSVAKKGQLVAYQWNGEQQLCPTNFVSVPTPEYLKQ